MLLQKIKIKLHAAWNMLPSECRLHIQWNILYKTTSELRTNVVMLAPMGFHILYTHVHVQL